MANVPLDSKKATKKQIEEGLALLQKAEVRKDRIASGEIKGGQKWSELNDETKAKRRQSGKERNAKLVLFSRKAQAAGITVSDAEVAAHMAKD